ncbi:MAG: exonuclease domain-containing protein [Ignavibacteriaceae bacterium]
MIAEDILSLTIDEAEFCIVDVETTGGSPRFGSIIEVGLVKVVNSKIVDRFHTLVNPGRDVPYYITSLTGITNDDVYNAPFFEEIADSVSQFISNDILTAHNLSFDKSFLRREFIYSGREEPENVSLCTLKIARRIYPALRSKSLGSVCRHLSIINPQAHRALPDAEVTAHVLIKMLREIKEKHKINYIGELVKFQSVPKSEAKQVKIKKKLGEDVSSLPDAPGIYCFLNSKNEIIYIGKAKSLKDRLKSYFSPTAPRKAKKIIKQASRLKIQITNSELTALLTEAEMIKVINPRHNTMLKRYGNKYFLRVTIGHPFPTIEISNYFDFDGNDYFGLFITKNKALSIFEMVQKTFALRECDDKEFGHGKKCFLADIERCTAPCINNDKAAYVSELEKVYEFLYGKNQYALNRLINKMKEYSEKQKYEKAAEVKQLIDMILAQTHKSSLLAEPVNLANVLFEITEAFGKDYVLMLEGKIYIKKYALKEKDYFETALDDYFERTLNLQSTPDNEDLEKMKITLNWLIKNRNKVRVFYLKEFNNKQELYTKLSRFNRQEASLPQESTFDIKSFLKEEEGSYIVESIP